MDVPPAFPTDTVVLNDPPAAQYDLIADLLDTNMFKLYSDMMGSETLLIHQRKTTKFGYLPMMTVTTLDVLNAESFCERVLSCLKLVVSDLHVRLKTDEIRMFVMLRMNQEFMEYMRRLTQTHLCRNSRQLIRMFAFMEESMLLTTMRTMSRSLR